MAEIELSCGVLEYSDRGSGPVVVLLHGLLMDSSLWDATVELLGGEYRCVVPTLPLGAHRIPVTGDLSLPAIAGLVRELLVRLDLRDVTLVGNDTGGALAQLLAQDERVARIVLASCDAFDNFPPGLTGKTLVSLGKLSPGLFGAFMQQMRVRLVRRLPISFGWLTKRGDAVVREWIRPVLGRPEIRRDAVRMLRSLGGFRVELEQASAAMARFDGPAVVVWAAEDRVMPVEHGRRLAELLPRGKLVEVADSYTLIPLDRPAEMASAIRLVCDSR
ncbi:alpha/beta fold hydrolase [Kutzneria kofuensis]|uniref:Pimeloyl-ACP methyl ester carboxylesterase n=1 Tax=Kutzneria kofuensis TaxID=103725 RepID=A0A7W9KNL5_9PSEU|nr:alpha/beta fold hydrolase [Kutzneria kofuensis]MBB5895861.1 pimeloyl-ACP methyl ester carboxylesterase [Kutzneria kofuensis]